MDLLFNNPKYLYLIKYKYNILKLCRKKNEYLNIILLIINNEIKNMQINSDVDISDRLLYCKKYNNIDIIAVKYKIFDYILNKNNNLYDILLELDFLIKKSIIYNYSLYDIRLIWKNLINIINHTESFKYKEYITIKYIEKQYNNLVCENNHYHSKIIKLSDYYLNYSKYTKDI